MFTRFAESNLDPALIEFAASAPGEILLEGILRLKGPGEIPPTFGVVSRFDRICTGRFRAADTWVIRNHPNVMSLKAARPLGLETRVPLPEAEVPARQPWANGSSVSERLPYTGRGVVVAALDFGIDFAHPNFLDEEGKTRLIAFWHQGTPYDPQHPNRFGCGRIFSGAEINASLSTPNPYRALGYHPAISDTGNGTHGTHTLDIAAGSGRALGAVSGMASRAELLFVHLSAPRLGTVGDLGNSVRLLEAIDFVDEWAAGRPCTINASIGRTAGPHDGTSLVEQGMHEFLRKGPGRAIVQSAGNYYASELAVHGQLRDGQSTDLEWIIDPGDVTGNQMDVWYSGSDRLRVGIRAPNERVFVEVELGDMAALMRDGRTIGRVYHRRHDPNNHDNHLELFLQPDAPSGTWVIRLIGEFVITGRFHAWIERDVARPSAQSRFSPQIASSRYTLGSIATSPLVITVGAYDANLADRPPARFSSSGPTRDGRNKPELVAPGVDIVAARSMPRGAIRQEGLLVARSGTSMAAPHVAGTVAAMFEAAGGPVSIDVIRACLQESSERWDTPEHAHRSAWGRLDPANAIQRILEWKESMEHRQLSARGHPSMGPRSQDETELSAAEFSNGLHLSGRTATKGGNMDRTLDRIERLLGRVAAEHRTEALFLAELLRELGADFEGVELTPSDLFWALVKNGALAPPLQDALAVLAGPAQYLSGTLRAGDWMVRRFPGMGATGHLAVAASGDLMTPATLAGRGVRAESAQPGYYAIVIEAGAFPHDRARPFARRVLDQHGRVLRHNLLLRPRLSDPWPAYADVPSRGPSGMGWIRGSSLEPVLDDEAEMEEEVAEAEPWTVDDAEDEVERFGPEDEESMYGDAIDAETPIFEEHGDAAEATAAEQVLSGERQDNPQCLREADLAGLFRLYSMPREPSRIMTIESCRYSPLWVHSSEGSGWIRHFIRTKLREAVRSNVSSDEIKRELGTSDTDRVRQLQVMVSEAYEEPSWRPALQIRIDDSWPERRESYARLWNAKGQLFADLARGLDPDIEPYVAAGIMAAESRQTFFRNGRPIIRFEAHVFWREWVGTSPARAAVFNRHFIKARPHKWRRKVEDAFEAYHGNQDREWEVFEFAQALDSLANTKVIESTSIGAGQIMGFNYARAGFSSPQELYQQYQVSERAQVTGIFGYIDTIRPASRRAEVIDGIKAGNFLPLSQAYRPQNPEAHAQRISEAVSAMRRLVETARGGSSVSSGPERSSGHAQHVGPRDRSGSDRPGSVARHGGGGESFDRNQPNVVVFGDSNTFVFGRALQQYLVETGRYPRAQIVVKYHAGSRPRNWLRPNHPLFERPFGELWTEAEQFRAGPPPARALSDRTELVQIGLGGNLNLPRSSRQGLERELESVRALVEQVAELAPNARIIWRGLPPATATRSGRVASREEKLARYMRNAVLKQELAPLGFRVIGVPLPERHELTSMRRAYLDLIAMHAGGPAPGDVNQIGTDAALAYERSVLESARDPATVAGERVTRGPWTEFVRGRDQMEVHVPLDAAYALVARHLAGRGIYEFGASQQAARPRAGVPSTTTTPARAERESEPRERSPQVVQPSGPHQIAAQSHVPDWTDVSGDERMRHVMELLVSSYNYPVNGAAGIVGNLWEESGVLPNRVEGSPPATPMSARNFDGRLQHFTPEQIENRSSARRRGPRLPGVGLAQWTSAGRREGLFQHAFRGQVLGAGILFDMDAQVDYLVTELRSGYRRVDRVLRSPGVSLNEASDDFVYNYEVPGAILTETTPRRKLPRSDAQVLAVFSERRKASQRALRAYSRREQTAPLQQAEAWV